MLRAVSLMLMLGLACAAAEGNGQRNAHEITEVPPCHVGGCSSQVCTDRSDLVTTCEWLPEYACYKTARCEPQPDGECGWTQTPDLVACIDAARQQ